jgi:hypothetical protein
MANAQYDRWAAVLQLHVRRNASGSHARPAYCWCGSARATPRAHTLLIVGIDIYVGSLSRYYGQRWRISVQEYGFTHDIPVEVVRPGARNADPLRSRTDTKSYDQMWVRDRAGNAQAENSLVPKAFCPRPKRRGGTRKPSKAQSRLIRLTFTGHPSATNSA